MSRFLELVRSRPVLYDGSMGATILNMQLSVEDYGGKEGCNDYLVLTRPDIIEGIHASYLEAGADVLETDTFGGSLPKLEEYGLGDRTYELNRAAAELARRVAKEYSTEKQPRFVAGSIATSAACRSRSVASTSAREIPPIASSRRRVSSVATVHCTASSRYTSRRSRVAR